MSFTRDISFLLVGSALIFFAFPQLNEGRSDCSGLEQCSCAAVEKKVVKSVVKAGHPEQAFLVSLAQPLLNGVYATSAIREKYPGWPPLVSCSLLYWDLTLNPEKLDQVLRPPSKGQSQTSADPSSPRPKPGAEPRRSLPQPTSPAQPPQPPQQPDQAGWWRYCNARFGQCADIPVSYKSDPPPANGDGLIFRDGRGMTVTVSAMFNVLGYSLKTEFEEEVKRAPKIAYKDSGTNWFVLSGYDGDNIYYKKRYVTPDHISSIWITYPARNRSDYESIVARMSSSFSPAKQK